MSALYIVAVRERINPDLASSGCCDYTSPPQPRDHALDLVRLLLGAAIKPEIPDGTGRWVRAIAGGQRTITLTPSGDHEPEDA